MRWPGGDFAQCWGVQHSLTPDLRERDFQAEERWDGHGIVVVADGFFLVGGGRGGGHRGIIPISRPSAVIPPWENVGWVLCGR